MPRGTLAAALVLLMSLSGCKATGNWRVYREGDGIGYECVPFEGHDSCELVFDLESAKVVVEWFKGFWIHVETLFGKTRHALEGGPPDGTTAPVQPEVEP